MPGPGPEERFARAQRQVEHGAGGLVGLLHRGDRRQGQRQVGGRIIQGLPRVVVEGQPGDRACFRLLGQDPVGERLAVGEEVALRRIQAESVAAQVRQSQGLALAQPLLQGRHPSLADAQVADDRLVAGHERQARERGMAMVERRRQPELRRPGEQRSARLAQPLADAVDQAIRAHQAVADLALDPLDVFGLILVPDGEDRVRAHLVR